MQHAAFVCNGFRFVEIIDTDKSTELDTRKKERGTLQKQSRTRNKKERSIKSKFFIYSLEKLFNKKKNACAAKFFHIFFSLRFSQKTSIVDSLKQITQQKQQQQ